MRVESIISLVLCGISLVISLSSFWFSRSKRFEGKWVAKPTVRVVFCAVAFVLALVACVWMFSLRAYADEQIDLDAQGSISLTLRSMEDNTPVSGGNVTIYQVASIAERDGEYVYVYTNGFFGNELTLGGEDDSDLVESLGNSIPAKAESTSHTVEKDGTVTFENLPVGLYLVTQQNTTPGYEPINAFLISVPSMEDGQLIYHANATPKVEVISHTDTNGKKDDSTTDTSKKTTEKNLPKTGQLNWPVPVLAATGMALFAVGWKLRRRGEAN